MEGEDVRLRELYWSIPTLQENIDHIRSNLKKTYKTLTSMKKSMEKYTEESHALANQLVGFSWSPTSEDKENMLVTCGAMITQIARVQNGLNNALHDILISAIDKILDEMKEDELREAQKQAYSQLVNYNNIHRKLNLALIERDEKKQKEQEEKKSLERVLIGLTNRLRDLQTVSRFDFTKSLLTWIYANIPAQTQMLEIFSGNKEEILDVMQGMERSKQEYLQGQTKGPSSVENIISVPRPMNEATDVTKQGYLYQQNHNGVWKPRFVILRQNEFSVFTSWKSKEVKYSANLMLSVVKPLIDPDTPFCFEIITQVKRAQFKAFNQVDYKAWMDILQHGIAEALNHIDSPHVTQSPLRMGSSQALSDTKLLNHLRELSDSNTMCADCGASDPDYVCINNGALVCAECSTVHRSLSQISKVRSLRTDKINPYIVSFLETMTNDIVNAIYLEQEPAVKISAQTVYKDRRLYIQRKYQFRQYAKARFSDSLEEVSQDLFSALLRVDYPEAVQFIVMGAMLDWKNSIDANKSLCHYVVEDSNVVGLWLLVLNDAPTTLQDSHGNTPLHYAANLAFPECVKVLLSVLTPEEVETRNVFSKTALDVARDHLMRAEEITDDMKEVVKVLEEFLYGPQEEQRLSTPRGGSEEADVTASPRSSEKKRRGSTVMDILKGMKDRRNSTAQLKKSDKRNSKANFRAPEKTASPRASLKFDESPTIKYYRQDEVVPLSPTKSGTFAYGASPYKDVDFNDLEALERAAAAVPTSPRRERSNSITITSSPRKDDAKRIAAETITEEPNTEIAAAETSGDQVPEPHVETTDAVPAPANETADLASNNQATEHEAKVATAQTETTKWRPVRTSSNSSGRALGKSESMAGSYRNNPYFTFRNSMRDQLEEFEAMERNGENPDEDLKSAKRAKEAPESRRISLQLGSNNTNSADGDDKLIPSPRSNKPQFQNIFATSKTDPSISTNNNNNNTNNEENSALRVSSGSVAAMKSSSSPTMRLSLEQSDAKSPSKDKDKKEKKEKDKKAPTPRSGRTKLLFRNKSKKEKSDKAE